MKVTWASVSRELSWKAEGVILSMLLPVGD